MSDYRAEAAARFPFATTAGHDHMAWAKRIQFRRQRGDTSLMPIQVTFATQALQEKSQTQN